MIAILFAFVALTLAHSPKAILDLAVHRDGGRALAQFGFVSVSLVFDSGQQCSNSNSWAAAGL